MKLLTKFLFLFIVFLIWQCAGDSGDNDNADEPPPAMSKIVGADEDRYFTDEKGNRFFPWGLNYAINPAIGLIDDQLHSDTAWQIIGGDFAEMKGLSANAVRIHLQYHRFMLDPWTPDPRAFDALERLVDIAEENRLYLIITGLGAYRKADAPLWYDSLSVEDRWNTQALFWKTAAGRVGNRAAVFAYDLMNEPVVSVCSGDAESCDWCVGEPFAGKYHFVQNISTDPGQPYSETKAAWIQQLTQAIRSEDSLTLITVGVLSNAVLEFYADHLDFVSPHVYPSQGQMQKLVDHIRSWAKSRPLVIEEFGNLNCSTAELGEFLRAIEGHYRGLFAHYNGQTLRELTAQGDMPAAFRRELLLFFVANNPNTQELTPVEP